jgi:hypothetical protein
MFWYLDVVILERFIFIFYRFRRVRKIAKATISFIMSVRPHGTTQLQ